MNQGKTVKPRVNDSLVSSNVYKISTMPGSVGFAKSLGNTSMQYPTNLDDTAGGAINFSNNASIPRPPFTLLTPEEDNLEDVHFMMVGYHQRQKTIVSNIEYRKKSKK